MDKKAFSLHPIFIAPPFGQFFSRADVSPVLGSYTVLARAGRYTQAIKTIRPLGSGNWVNRIGLRNPGIDAIPEARHASQILSIAAIEPEDWQILADKLSNHSCFTKYAALELNLGCPNACTAPLLDSDLLTLQSLATPIIVKLPPLESSLDQIERLSARGVRIFHLFNTYPTARGGLSGQLLRRINLRLIRRIRANFGNSITIIAGGGVHHLEDAKHYLEIGVQGISLGTICYYPWRVHATIAALQRLLPHPIER